VKGKERKKTMYKEMLASVRDSKRMYETAQKKVVGDRGKAEGVLQALTSNIERTKSEYDACVKGQETLKQAAHAIEQYTSDGLKSVYQGLEKMLSHNLSQMNGGRIVVNETSDSKGRTKLEVAVMEPSGTGSGEEKRDLADDCGHGIGELVSLFLTCSLVSNSARAKVVLLDEFVSGVSSENLFVIDKVIQYMHDNGFVVVINEHGFIPSNADVYELKNTNGVSKCAKKWHSDAPVCREIQAANA
jgi:DNA repair ATPase RecN